MGKIIIGLTDHTQKEDPKMEEQEEQGKKESTVLPEPTEITVKNPRIGKVRKLEEEVKRQNELEQLRTRRIRKEQEYIEQMSKAVEDHLRNTKEEQRYNEEFERLIRKDVYQMHGISEDKLQGMTEYRYALYRGTAFGMFFLSLILTGICGYLHGFGSELCIFMAFYTAIEGTLLNNGKRQHAILDVLTRILYLLLFPAMKTLEPKRAENKAEKAAVNGSAEAATVSAPSVQIDLSKVKIEPLFADDVDFETFSKSDFRVVKIEACEAVPKSKKLLKFTLNDGTDRKRTILSGIHEYYEPEELVGKTCVAITNLPPRKMMGIDSEGMLISAVYEYDGREGLNLLMLDDSIPAGAKLY